MQRRAFMRLAGGGAVLAAAAGAAWFAGRSAFEVPPAAVAAWSGPAGEEELRRWVLAHALLAPNPHNMQPWLADLRQPGRITLHLDPQRMLPATDPWGRQIMMGVGCFVELLHLAAAQRGHGTRIQWFPDGEPAPRLDGRRLAVIELLPDHSVKPDPLFAQVLHRRTDRRAYDPAGAPRPADLELLQSAVAGLEVTLGVTGRAGASAGEQAQLEAIRAIARQAWRIELLTEPAMMESMRVLRVGASEIERHRDGIAITSPLLVMLERSGLFDRTRFPAADSQAIQGQIRDFDVITAATPAYLWLLSKGNQRREQLEAGRAYMRVALAASALGLALHPNQQALQEYPEVAAPYRAIHETLGARANGQTVQMLARLGRLRPDQGVAGPAPRRGLPALLMA